MQQNRAAGAECYGQGEGGQLKGGKAGGKGVEQKRKEELRVPQAP